MPENRAPRDVQTLTRHWRIILSQGQASRLKGLHVLWSHERAACVRSQLLNACAERLVDERVLNKPAVPGGALSHTEREENARLFLDAARAHGCYLGDATPTDIADRKACTHT